MLDAWFDELAASAFEHLASQREAAIVDIARSYLPRPLRWTVNHPRALAVVYRLRASWRPQIIRASDGGTVVESMVDESGTRIVVLEVLAAAPRSVGGFDQGPCILCAREEPCSCGDLACGCSCGRCQYPFALPDDGPLPEDRR